MLITITGKLGSGKSTICRVLSERCGFEVYSTGVIHRDLAKRMGIDTLALNRLMAGDSSYDRVIDDEVRRISRERRGDALVFDSRLAWHFVDRSLKLFTTVDPVVAARRILDDDRGCEERYLGLDDALDNLRTRAGLERERFREIYGVDYCDYANFDLIVDTTWLDPDSLVSLILEERSRWNGLDGPPRSEILISPKSLYPTRPPSGPATAPGDLFRSEPLRVALGDGYHFVVGDGASALGAALEAGLPYVFAALAPPGDSPALEGLDPGLLARAQEMGGFTYASVPDAYRPAGPGH